jgi:hypothetical protein
MGGVSQGSICDSWDSERGPWKLTTRLLLCCLKVLFLTFTSLYPDPPTPWAGGRPTGKPAVPCFHIALHHFPVLSQQGECVRSQAAVGWGGLICHCSAKEAGMCKDPWEGGAAVS